MRNKLKFILLGSISAFSLISVAVGTVAWFNNALTFSGIDGKISGDSAAAYFAYGDGSDKENAYGIRTARQLYNLAWLQYNGAFNKDANEDGVVDKQYYFEIDPSIDEIDMSGWVLPPIGTEDYPFIGSFNGNGKTIKSLTISNKANLSKPNAIDYDVQPEVVGLFGVVGKIDSLPYTYDSTINEVKDVTLNTITVESKTNKTLIGLAAGYMNGEMSGVEVSGTATIDVNGQTTSAKTNIDGVTNLSDYSLVGYTTKKSNSSDSYSQKLSEYYSMGGSGVDPTWGGSLNVKNYNHWLYYLSKVKGYDGNNAMSQSGNTLTGTGYKGVFTSSSTYNPEDNSLLYLSTTSRYVKLYDDGTGIYYLNGTNYSFTWEDSVSGNVYGYKITFNSNTKIGSTTAKIFYFNRIIENPVSGSTLRFYKAANGKGDSGLEGSTSYTPYVFHIYRNQIGAYYPLKYTDTSTWTEQKTNTVATDNSGYITGATGSSSTNGAVKLASYPISHIYNSISDTAYEMKNITLSHGFKNISYNDSNLEILTYKDGTGWVLIEDSHNKNHTVANSKLQDYTKTGMTPESLFRDYKKYNKSRDKLNAEVLSGAKKIHAIHFDAPASGYGIGGANNIQSYSNVNIDGYSGTYKMPAGAIDFKIHDKGVINFFAGAYNSADVNMSFFSLYKIERDGSNNITSINEIRRIYDNPDYASDNTQNPYIYSYTNAKPSGATDDGLVKNLDSSLRVTQVPVKNALYYFELPVNAGEYCMAISSATSNQGAYLMYLDIGASGSDKDDIKAYSITTISGGNSFPSGVDFLPITVTGNGGCTIGVEIASGKQGVIAFVITDNKIDVDNDDQIGAYSYRNETNYAASSPAENKFTCTLSGQPPSVSAGGERVLSITLKPVSNQTTYDIRIIDQLDNTGNVTGTPIYEVNGAASSLSAINTLLSTSGKNINASLNDNNSLRNLTLAATLTRTSGSGVFTTEYNTSLCSYSDKIVAITITKNGTGVSITVETGYKVKIGDDTYNPGTMPVN